MVNRRLLRSLGPVLLLAVGGAYALASGNWCGQWTAGDPEVTVRARASGELSAGAAKVPLEPPYPIVAAGYPPPRPAHSDARPALHARALVFAAGDMKVGLVALDLLTISPELEQAVRAQVPSLTDVWVIATHTHASFGAYDERLVSQLAGTGRFRKAAQDAAVRGAVDALQKAEAALRPATLHRADTETRALAWARTGSEVERRVLRLVVREALAESGAEPGAEPRVEAETLAELWLLAAHPTLVPRKKEALSPDYPGQVEEEGGPVTLVLQSAAGNAGAAVPEGDGVPSERFADVLEDTVRALEPARLPVDVLAVSRVRFGLPRPDSSRLAPWFARAAGDNLLCGSTAKHSEVAALQVGPLRLLAIPAEPSLAAGRVLEAGAGDARVVGLVGGYVGYVEPAAVVNANGGEAKRQYFGDALLKTFGDASALASEALEPQEQEQLPQQPAQP